jgi:purine-binding chemotaxis protein CheW
MSDDITTEMAEETAEKASIKAADKTGNSEIYGTFFMGKTELAVSIKYLQEVVKFPEHIDRMPLAPDYLIGVFNLRGTIVPIVNLKKLMKIEPSDFDQSHKIAILDFEGVNVGFVFDVTGEIIRPKPNEQSEFQYKKESQYKIIKGALKLDDGKRLLQVLDPEALISIQNLPILTSSENFSRRERFQRKNKAISRKKCITFSVSNIHLAFEITGIHEIVTVPEIQNSAMESDLCLGIINLRGQIVPVLSFAAALKLNVKQEERQTQIQLNSKRIIILKIENEFFGLLVDTVDSINTYDTENVMPIPLLTKDRMKMFQGALSLDGLGNVILLNHLEILSNEEILQITHGHAKIYSAENDGKKDSLKAKGRGREVFILFRLNHRLGFPIRDIQEIIDYPAEVLDAPGAPNCIKGILNLRGTLVSLVDTRVLYKMAKSETAESYSPKVIICKKNEEFFGFIVDTVENILTVYEHDRLDIPSILRQDADKSFQKDIREAIKVSAPDGSDISFIVLNVDAIIERLRGFFA